MAVMYCDGRTQDFVVPRQCGLHGLGVFLPKTGRAFDIGE
jgi:hypothetical protein